MKELHSRCSVSFTEGMSLLPGQQKVKLEKGDFRRWHVPLPPGMTLSHALAELLSANTENGWSSGKEQIEGLCLSRGLGRAAWVRSGAASQPAEVSGSHRLWFAVVVTRSKQEETNAFESKEHFLFVPQKSSG